MKIADIEARIAEIKAMASDNERAHSLEDGLQYDVLTAIAEGKLRGSAAREAATLALTTSDISFVRWYA